MNQKVKVLWITGLSCNGNSHSFLNYTFLEQFLNDFEFINHPLIEGSHTLEEVVNKIIPCDILLIEGSISPEIVKADKNLFDIIYQYSKIVSKVVTVGTCATFGGIFRQSEYKNITGLHFDEKDLVQNFLEIRHKTISISGCPIHPEYLGNTLYAIKDELVMHLDEYLRPKEYFAYTVHNGCVRNEYFEYKVDNHLFGKKEGCMFYDHGCQGPFTRGSCNKILWNEVNSKTRAGQPCMGCTEPEFPKSNLFATKKNMGIPATLPIGIGKRTYLTLAGVTKAFKITRLEKELFDD